MTKPSFELGAIARDRSGDSIEASLSAETGHVFIGFRGSDSEEEGSVLLPVNVVRSFISALSMMCDHVEGAAIQAAIDLP